jgi:hypothetical protein
MMVSAKELFNLLKTKIGDQEAKILVEYVENKIETQTNLKIEGFQRTLATKQDLAETKAELLKWMIVLFAPFYVGMIVFLIKQFP